MSATIDPAALYTLAELRDTIGPAAFAHAQAAGLYAVGDLYLGAKVLDALATAHDNVARVRSQRRGATDHETPQVAARPAPARLHRPPRDLRASDVLRQMEKAG